MAAILQTAMQLLDLKVMEDKHYNTADLRFNRQTIPHL
jgi:hypothetical protein